MPPLGAQPGSVGPLVGGTVGSPTLQYMCIIYLTHMSAPMEDLFLDVDSIIVDSHPITTICPKPSEGTVSNAMRTYNTLLSQQRKTFENSFNNDTLFLSKDIFPGFFIAKYAHDIGITTIYLFYICKKDENPIIRLYASKTGERGEVVKHTGDQMRINGDYLFKGLDIVPVIHGGKKRVHKKRTHKKRNNRRRRYTPKK